MASGNGIGLLAPIVASVGCVGPPLLEVPVVPMWVSVVPVSRLNLVVSVLRLVVCIVLVLICVCLCILMDRVGLVVSRPSLVSDSLVPMCRREGQMSLFVPTCLILLVVCVCIGLGRDLLVVRLLNWLTCLNAAQDVWLAITCVVRV